MKNGFPFPFLAITLFTVFASLTCPRYGTSSEPPDEIHRSNRILTHDPIIEVKIDGTVQVHVKTTKPCTGGLAYLGLMTLHAELEYPVYRVTGETSPINANTLLFEFSLRELENKAMDEINRQGNQNAHVALRLCLFGDKLYTLDRIFAYRRSLSDEYNRSTALIEGPFVDWVTDSSAVLSWKFDQPSDCRLDVDPGQISQEYAPPGKRYEVLLLNLLPSAKYKYAITWDGHNQLKTTVHREFRTAPPTGSDRPFNFAVLSDARASQGAGDRSVEGVNQRILQALLNRAYNLDVSLFLFPGDLVSGYTSEVVDLESQYRSWKRAVAPVGSRIPIYEGMGNHDVTARFFEGSKIRDCAPRSGEEASEVIFAHHFVNPTNGPDPTHPDHPPYRENVYSFDWGNCHFTMLNNNYMQKGSGESVANLRGEIEGTLRPEQLTWLDEDLKAARQRRMRYLFVFAHEPAFPNGGHTEDAMWWEGVIPEVVRMRNTFWKILCEYNVLAAFFGDEHNFSLSYIDETVDSEFDVPVWQIVTGGAGAPYYLRDENVPWAGSVKSFYPYHHCCVINVADDSVVLNVITPEGILLESVQLTGSESLVE